MASPVLNHASLLNAVVSAAPGPHPADGWTALLTRALDEVDYALMLFQQDQLFQYFQKILHKDLNYQMILLLNKNQEIPLKKVE